ncbi:Acetolactate synthase isozyme 3 small subunit [Buchnera aphidicola (Cinara pseudotaxifoliae)]|uniref:Acetolactate synthase small subunit n=1 Tax=Buchnera aphidicola (Cinara pseudotaxifoliae) TaxID=655384 RepID=A0A451DGQ5_9GAMM|nr:acetolactate synthase small subunit [Buchnera aphidicola]VFP85810.1 Acetolactate synthase isozyme 3 small subunit [Buchnera aphidicola (Cinara pseudotaxifoliae)]
MRRILSILLENESGALSRVIGLFSQRGYNIDSLTVAPTENNKISRLTIQTFGNKKTIEQIEKQLQKLIDVHKVVEITNKNYVEREILLIKIKIHEFKKLHKVNQLLEIYQGIIIDCSSEKYIIQISGTNNIIDSFLKIIQKSFKIIELSRSGVISINCH